MLTPREREIVELISDGRTNKEISGRLRLSMGTVATYLHRIFRKLRARDRTHAAVIVQRRK